MKELTPHNHFLSYLTSRQIAEMPDKGQAVVVLPVASIEQHGPHLPVYTDSLILQEVITRTLANLPHDFPVWMLPLLPYGKSNEHGAYAGTITMTSETFISVLNDIGAGVAHSGFRRLAILNGHGGNCEIIDFVIRDIRERTGLLVFALHVFLRIFPTPPDALSKDELIYGIHAGDIETSILLRVCPELVHMELAPNSIPDHLRQLKHPPFMGPLNFAWLTQDITDTGVLGDATAADAQKGEYMLSGVASQLAELLKEIVDFEFAERDK